MKKKIISIALALSIIAGSGALFAKNLKVTDQAKKDDVKVVALLSTTTMQTNSDDPYPVY